MSALIGVAQTAEVALSAATARTVVQLVAPSNHRLRILRLGFFFDGVSVTAEPVQVRLLRQTSAGTMTALTLTKLDDSIADTLQATAQHSATGTEPTAGDVIDVWECHPQQGFERDYPLGQEPIVGGGDRVGLEFTAPAVVNVRAKIVYEE
jgi:hypothetical protein